MYIIEILDDQVNLLSPGGIPLSIICGSQKQLDDQVELWIELLQFHNEEYKIRQKGGV